MHYIQCWRSTNTSCFPRHHDGLPPSPQLIQYIVLCITLSSGLTENVNEDDLKDVYRWHITFMPKTINPPPRISLSNQNRWCIRLLFRKSLIWFDQKIAKNHTVGSVVWIEGDGYASSLFTKKTKRKIPKNKKKKKINYTNQKIVLTLGLFIDHKMGSYNETECFTHSFFLARPLFVVFYCKLSGPCAPAITVRQSYHVHRISIENQVLRVFTFRLDRTQTPSFQHAMVAVIKQVYSIGYDRRWTVTKSDPL